MSGAFGTNWLDLSSTSNRYIQSYYKGFVDISGGPLYVRNNNLFVQGGDVSLNGRFYGSGDVSLNSRLYVGSDASFGGNLYSNFLSTSISIAQSPLTRVATGNGIATSSTGQYVITGGSNTILFSSNYGVSFTTVSGINDGVNTFSVSSTGQYMIACGSFVWVSSNYGVTWTKQTTTLGTSFNGAAVSDNGYMLTASIGVGLSITTNSGTSWTTVTTTLNNQVRTCAISSTGQYMLVGLNGGNLYYSNNSGSSWSVISSPNTYWTNTTMSKNGQYMAACAPNNTQIQLSSNYGVTWTAVTVITNPAFYTISMSHNGQYLIVGSGGGGADGNVYFSKNYGVSWSNITPSLVGLSGSWVSSSMSSAGQYIYINDQNGYLYSMQLTPVSTTSILGTISSTGDVSLNQRLFLGSDASLGGNLSIAKDMTIGGNLYVQTYNARNMITELSYQLIVAEDISVNGRLFLSNDASINNRLFVGSDSSFGGRLFVAGDVSLNGNVFVTTQASTDNSTKVATTAYVKTALSAITGASAGFTGDVSINYRLYVGADASLQGRLFVTNDVSLNNRLYVGSDVSLGGNLNIASTRNFIMNNFATPILNPSTFGTSSTTTLAAPVGGTHIATSYTGQYVLTCSPQGGSGLGLSTNYGSSFSNISTGQSFSANTIFCCTISSDGSKMAITTGATIYYSTNYGVSWTSGATLSAKFLSATSDFTRLYAYGTGGVYLSTNYGSSFTLQSSSIGYAGLDVGNNNQGNNLKFQMNASTGQYGLAFSSTAIYYTSNYGVTWALSTGLSGIAIQGTAIGVSSTGQYCIVDVWSAGGGGGGKGCYYSSNYGSSFSAPATTTGTAPSSPTNTYNGWRYSPTISPSGKYIIVGSSMSTDYGVSFQYNPQIVAIYNTGGDMFLLNCIISGNELINYYIMWGSGLLYSQQNPTLNLYSQSLSITSDISTNSRLFISNDTSMNSRLYVLGDVSMSNNLYVAGQTIQRGDVSANARLYVGSDASFGSRVFVAGDLSLNGNVSIGSDLTVGGNMYVKAYTTKQMITELSYQLIVAQDLSVNGRLFLSNDASINNRLFVGSDVSMGGKLFTLGDTSHNARLFVGSDASFGTRVFIAGDLSVNGNVNVNGLFTAVTQTSTDNSTKVATTAYVKTALSAVTGAAASFTGDVSINYRLYVGSDASFGGNVGLTGANFNVNNTKNSVLIGASFGLVPLTFSSSSTAGYWGETNSVSYSGQYILASDPQGGGGANKGVLISSDYGVTTKVITGQSFSTLQVFNTAMSADGSKMALTTQGTVCYSTNYGVSWTTGSYVVYSIAFLSATGDFSKLYGLGGNGVFLSTNYGATFSIISTAISNGGGQGNTTANNNRFCMNSSTGQYGVAISGGTLYYTSNSGVTWTASTGVTGVSYLMMSSTGQYVIADTGANSTSAIYYSSNYGQTFTVSTVSIAPTSRYSAGGMDATGQYCTISYLISTNYGVNWTQSPAINAIYSSDFLTGSAVSGNGLYNYFFLYGSRIINIQKNYATNTYFPSLTLGTDLSTNSKFLLNNDAFINGNLNSSLITTLSGDVFANSRLFVAGDVSFNKRLFVTGDVSLGGALGLTGGNIYVNNVASTVLNPALFGSTTLTQSTNTVNNSNWGQALACSNTGQYIMIGNPQGIQTGLWISTNYGSTLTQVTGQPFSTLVVISVAISGDGSKMAVCTGSSVYYSTNSGTSWSSATSISATYLSATSDFTRLYAYGTGGVFVSTNNGSTFTSLSTTITYSGSTGSGNWGNVNNFKFAMNSSTGQYGLAYFSSNIYYTANYGATWTISTGLSGIGAGSYIGLSSSGKYAVIDNGGSTIANTLFYSSNFGVSFTASTVNDVTSLQSRYGSAPCSPSGRYGIVGNLVTTDYGANWYYSSRLNSIYSTGFMMGNVISGNELYNIFMVYGSNNLYIQQNTTMTQYSPSILITSDISTNSRLFINNDVSMASNLYVGLTSIYGGDISANARLYVGSDVSFGGRLYLANDASLNGNVSIANDLTVNGNMYVKAYTTRQMITELSYQLIIAEDISVNGRLFLSNDASINNRLFVGADASFGSRLFTVGDVSLNSRLYVGGDASFGSRLFTVGDVSFNNRLYVGSDVSFGGNFYVGKNVGIAKAPTYPLDISGISRTSGGVILGTLPTTKYYNFAGTPSTATITTPSLTFTFGNSSFYAKFHCFLSDASTNTVSTVVFDVQGGNAAGTTPSNNIAEITRVSTINGYYQWLQPTYTTTTVVLGTTANTGVVANYSVRVELIQTNAVLANVPTLNSITMVNNNAGGTVVTSFAY